MPAWNKDEDDDRREFLKTCGRFAAVTPPAMTLLLSTSLTSRAIATSGGQGSGGSGGSGGTGSKRSFFDNDFDRPTETNRSEHRSSTADHHASQGGSGGGGGGKRV